MSIKAIYQGNANPGQLEDTSGNNNPLVMHGTVTNPTSSPTPYEGSNSLGSGFSSSNYLSISNASIINPSSGKIAFSFYYIQNGPANPTNGIYQVSFIDSSTAETGYLILSYNPRAASSVITVLLQRGASAYANYTSADPLIPGVQNIIEFSWNDVNGTSISISGGTPTTNPEIFTVSQSSYSDHIAGGAVFYNSDNGSNVTIDGLVFYDNSTDVYPPVWPIVPGPAAAPTYPVIIPIGGIAPINDGTLGTIGYGIGSNLNNPDYVSADTFMNGILR